MVNCKALGGRVNQGLIYIGTATKGIRYIRNSLCFLIVSPVIVSERKVTRFSNIECCAARGGGHAVCDSVHISSGVCCGKVQNVRLHCAVWNFMLW